MHRKSMWVNALYSYPYLNQKKTLGPSYSCLHFLFNKIGHKGKIVSAWNEGVRGEGGCRMVKGGGGGKEEEMTQTLYVHMNKKKNS
jgi:hypothetical protein